MESRSWLRSVTAKEKGRGRECAAESCQESPPGSHAGHPSSPAVMSCGHACVTLPPREADRVGSLRVARAPSSGLSEGTQAFGMSRMVHTTRGDH